MNLEINDALIPGTKLNKADMGNVTGLEFLSKVFYISEGVMLSQKNVISDLTTVIPYIAFTRKTVMVLPPHHTP